MLFAPPIEAPTSLQKQLQFWKTIYCASQPLPDVVQAVGTLTQLVNHGTAELPLTVPTGDAQMPIKFE